MPDPHSNRPDVSLIVPVLNNHTGMAATLDLAGAALRERSYEILVVVNDRVDGPALRDTRNYAMSTDGNVQAHQLRTDKAGAIRWGFERAAAPIVGFIDADLGWEAEPEQLRTLVSAIDRGETDCAIAERDQTEWSSIRRAKTNYFAALGRLLFRLPVRDSQAAMKVMTADAAATALEFCAFRGWEFDIELLWVLNTAGHRITPYPMYWRGRGGETGWASTLLIFVMAPRMIANLLILRPRAWRQRSRIRGTAA